MFVEEGHARDKMSGILYLYLVVGYNNSDALAY